MSPSMNQFDVEAPLPTGGMGQSTTASHAAAPPAVSIFSPSSWTTFLQAMFDVSTSDILGRIMYAAMPWQSVVGESPFSTKPDFYGPFWIATTAIITMTGAANIERLFVQGREGTDYSLMWTAAWFMYGCLIAVPVIVYGFTVVTKQTGSQEPGAEQQGVNYMHIFSVYGYGNLALIPVSLLCVLPARLVHVVAIAVGAAISGLFIRANLWKLLPQSQLRVVVVGAALICQAATYLAFYHLFLSSGI